MKDVTYLGRGQIWFWEDPIYGKKNGSIVAGDDIPHGERNIHFSRYVVILQHPETSMLNGRITNILVAPISSTKSIRDYDVPIKVYEDCGKESHILLGRIFCASSSQLKNYVGTVSCAIMERIDTGLRAMMLEGPCIDLTPMIDASEKVFEDDEATDIPDCDTTDDQDSAYDSNVVEDKECRIEEDSPEKNVAEDVADGRVKQKWDEEGIKKFLYNYSLVGPEAAAKQYSIGERTAKNYWYKYRKLYAEQDARPGSIVNDIKSLSSSNIQMAVNTFTHMIKRSLNHGNLFGRLLKKQALPDRINNEYIFYEELQHSLFWGVIKAIEVRNDSGTYILPEINDSMRFPALVYILDKLTCDHGLSVIRTVDKMLERFYKNYGDIKIEPAIIFELMQSITYRFRRLPTSGKEEIEKQLNHLLLGDM